MRRETGAGERENVRQGWERERRKRDKSGRERAREKDRKKGR